MTKLLRFIFLASMMTILATGVYCQDELPETTTSLPTPPPTPNNMVTDSNDSNQEPSTLPPVDPDVDQPAQPNEVSETGPDSDDRSRVEDQPLSDNSESQENPESSNENTSEDQSTENPPVVNEPTTNNEEENKATEVPEEEEESKVMEKETPQENDKPVQEPKVFLFQHHFRDPITGILHSRQIPVIASHFGPPKSASPRHPLFGDIGNRRYGPPPSAPEEPKLAEPSPFDPLGQYSETQKKRQFYQDMLMSQLNKFESIIDSMAEKESNMTEKNDMEEVLASVAELRQMLEHHQIFNISEIMNQWKEGKLRSSNDKDNEKVNDSEQDESNGEMDNSGGLRPNKRPMMVMRTLILVPKQAPQQSQYQPTSLFADRQPFQYTVSRPEASLFLRRRDVRPTNWFDPRTRPMVSNGQYGDSNRLFTAY